MSRVAVLGLGAMGSRIAAQLLSAGNEVAVWNRTPGNAEPLVELGAEPAASLDDAVRGVELVITMLADADALRTVVDGPEGVAAALGPGTTVIDMSTVGAEAVAWLESALPTGTPLLDAPVLGSLAEAESGSLTIFAGGPSELVEQWELVLATLGTVAHVGPLGSGQAAKLVANTTLFGAIGVLGEALALADGLGLSREAAFDVLASTPMAAQAERRRASLEAGEYPPRFPLSLARKDADLVAEAAAAAGADLRLAEAARSWLHDAEDAGLGDADYSAVLDRILDPEPDDPPLRQAVISRTVRSVGYQAGTLELEFTSGNVYRYLDVPKSGFLEFMQAMSKGSFFNERIRDSFRVEGPV